jgi:class 3 adenylate cyclase/tetratricopeptide (TPR) repeat protein
VTCPVCGTVAVPGARFCHNCGAALPAAAVLPAAERRIVTVLFGDLSDFTAWSEEHDPERVGAVTDRVLAALAGSVKTFGGHVDKLTGDGIMAVFGAPVAHEDDAERAVRAALSMQRAVRRVLDDERGGGAPLGLRVGLNTGEVVAGVQAALEYTVIGDTVNTAARLADAATIGTVYAGERTSASTRHVASWRRLRPLRLKGKRAPVEAAELLGLLDAPGTRSGLGDEAPFVGRETELARVASRLSEVVDRGEPRVLVMTGEAGLGKTRFGTEVGRFVARSDLLPVAPRVLAVHCAAYGDPRRLAPLADLVRISIGLGAEQPGAARREAVEERLRRLGTRLHRTAPAAPRFAVEPLLELLGYGDGHLDGLEGAGGARDSAPDREPLAPVPEFDIEAVPAAVADLLSALAQEAPLLVMVDDLHDATPDTIDALGVALSRLTGPVLLLLLGRPELVRTAGVLTRLADAEVATLPALRGADAARLVGAYLDGGRLAQPDEDQLLATAQGNPFYLAELITLLIERGALTAVSGGTSWRLSPGSLDGRLLSRDLAAVLAARIDALPPGARHALRDAAVVGDTVAEGALTALRELRGDRDGRPDAVAAVEQERAIEELLQRRMLRRVRGGYAFATPLLREAAYAGIGKTDLAERHAHLARWAAPSATPGTATLGRVSVVPDGSAGNSAEVADMFVAEQVEKAAVLADAVGLRPDVDARTVAPLGVAALARSARRAIAAGEPGQAVQYAERAAALAPDGLPDGDRLVHAQALLELGRPADALAYAEKISANAGDDLGTRSGALLLAGRAYRLLGDGSRSYSSWLDALAAAAEGHLPGEQAAALRWLGMADFLAGRLTEASSRFTSAYLIAVRDNDAHSQAWSLQNLAWVATTRGDFAGADATLGRAARLFAEQHDPIGRAWMRGTTAFGRLLAGRLTEARRLARLFLPFGERVGEQWAVGTLRAVDAFAAAELGDLAEADKMARRAYRDFAVATDDWGRGLALVVRGTVARGLGQLDHANDLLTDALGYGEKTSHPLLIGMARTIRGFVGLARGDAAAALADAEAVFIAVEPHHITEPASIGPRALLGAARLAAGDTETALPLLESVATQPAQAALLFPRRLGVSLYAAALRAAGRPAEALAPARLAVALPGEDVRSRVAALRELATCLAVVGEAVEARRVAAEAVRAAYGTQQVSERAAADELLRSLVSPAAAPGSGPAATLVMEAAAAPGSGPAAEAAAASGSPDGAGAGGQPDGIALTVQSDGAGRRVSDLGQGAAIQP